MIEIDVLQVDEDRREETFDEVINEQGPPDGSVIVALASKGEFAENTVDEILTTLGEIGEIILVR